jgi:hypothetical protein
MASFWKKKKLKIENLKEKKQYLSPRLKIAMLGGGPLPQ